MVRGDGISELKYFRTLDFDDFHFFVANKLIVNKSISVRLSEILKIKKQSRKVYDIRLIFPIKELNFIGFYVSSSANVIGILVSLFQLPKNNLPGYALRLPIG